MNILNFRGEKEMRVPLSASFTAFSLIGFIVSLFFTIFERIPPSWGFLMIFVFTIFIISSMISVLPDKDDVY